jgi:transposase InsO family protein
MPYLLLQESQICKGSRQAGGAGCFPYVSQNQEARRQSPKKDRGNTRRWLHAHGPHHASKGSSPGRAGPPEYHQYLKVFSKKESERLPSRKIWDHAIELKEGFQPKKGRMINLSVQEQQEVSDFIDSQLAKGYIRPSKSPQTSPVFFVPKPDGKKRMVQDYRHINEWTVKNNYPLPLISQLVDKLKGAKLFTKMDLRWGYNNIRIKEGDEWKAAFVCHKGSFEPLVMYFGMCNSPATFQEMMNELFSDMDNVVIIYLDDLMIFTKTDSEEEHDRLILKVLQRLAENDLFVKPEKCTFKAKEVDFLGMVVSAKGISMNEGKVHAIRNWPVPKKVRDVRAFLGFGNFYRRFIQDFAKITRPLNDLTKKDHPWIWGDPQQDAFDKLKEAFTTAPILAYPDNDCKFRVECDASNFATGAVLSMEKDGLWHPCAFSSHSLNAQERNYQIADKEMLAIIRALEQWRHYLEGAKFQFEIWSDHANLQYFMKSQDLNRRQARWALYLSRFNFHLVYKVGSSMGKADALSRREDHAIGIEEDNKDVVLIKPEWLRDIGRTDKETAITIDSVLTEEIVKATKKEEKDQKIDKKNLHKEKNGLYTYKGRIYIPKDTVLRTRILTLHHDTPVAGHPGEYKTQKLVERSFWWPKLKDEVKEYVRRCDRCARFKGRNAPPPGKLQPLPIPAGPWEDISADFITDLPLSNGFDSILVVIDRFSKEAVFIPTVKTVTSLDTAKLYRDNVWKVHGTPKSLVSDRGPQFASKLMTDLSKMIGIELKLSTAFHPQTDGQTERLNRDLQQYLRIFTCEKQREWADWLAIAQFAYNNKTQEATRKSPFEITRTYQTRMGVEITDSNVPGAIQEAEAIKSTLEQVQRNLELAQQRMKSQADKHRSIAPEYKIGDQVWLSTANLKLQRESRKLTERWLGPYAIVKLVGPNAVELKLPRGMRIHPVVNISRVKPYRERLPGQPIVKPGGVLVTEDGQQEYVVEKIIDSRLKQGKIEFLVHWEGYEDVDRTWEPEGNLSNAPEKVKEFYAHTPSAPRRLKNISMLQFSQLFKPYQNFTTTPLIWSRLESEP